MGKEYLKHELPEALKDICIYLSIQYKEYGIRTIPFVQKYAGVKVAFTVNGKSNSFLHDGKPLNSLEEMGFGTISWSSKVTNEGDFTISEELIEWYEYINSSKFKQLRKKTDYWIQEHTTTLNFLLSVFAIIISVISLLISLKQ